MPDIFKASSENGKKCHQKGTKICVQSLVILAEVFLALTGNSVGRLCRAVSREISLTRRRLQQETLCLAESRLAWGR